MDVPQLVNDASVVGRLGSSLAVVNAAIINICVHV